MSVFPVGELTERESTSRAPDTGIWLLASSQRWGAEGTTPAALRTTARWSDDIDFYGPWKAVSSLPGWPESGLAWKSSRKAEGPAVLVCGPCASNLDVVWTMLSRADLPAWSAVLAVSQSLGRGQYRRRWESPAGNVFAAWVLPDALSGTAPGATPFSTQLTPLLTGLLVAEGLELALDVQRTAVRLAVKWPNDILLDGHKVGGILIEERAGRCVAGVGLNLSTSPALHASRDSWAPPAGQLGSIVQNVGPLKLWVQLVQAARHVFVERLAGQPASVLAGCVEERLAWLGNAVEVKEAVCEKSGKHFDKLRGNIVGLAVDGALRLAMAGGEKHLVSGSVTPAFSAGG